MIPIVTVGKPLRDKLGDEAVDAMIELINNSQAQHKNEILEFVEEKFERRLVEEVGKLEVKISKVEHKISETKADLITRISETKAELITRISETKADLIKWMFIFWVGQIGVMVGILFVFFKR